MKRLIAVFFISLPLFLRAQDTQSIPKLPIDSASGLVSYKEVNIVDNAKSVDLYKRGREWFALNFKSANDVLQMDDKDSGKIIGKGSAAFTYVIHGGLGTSAPVPITVTFTISITVKDYKYRVIMSDFEMTSGAARDIPLNEPYLHQWDDYKEKKKPSRIIKQAMQMQFDFLNDINKLGYSTLAGIKAAMLKQANDDF